MQNHTATLEPTECPECHYFIYDEDESYCRCPDTTWDELLFDMGRE